MSSETDTCTVCKEEKSLSEFYKKANARGGHRPECKQCGSAKSRRYYKENRETYDEYRARNSKRIAEYCKKYREKNRVKMNEYYKKWYAENDY